MLRWPVIILRNESKCCLVVVASVEIGGSTWFERQLGQSAVSMEDRILGRIGRTTVMITVGIDISKATLDIFSEGKHKKLTNRFCRKFLQRISFTNFLNFLGCQFVKLIPNGRTGLFTNVLAFSEHVMQFNTGQCRSC